MTPKNATAGDLLAEVQIVLPKLELPPTATPSRKSMDVIRRSGKVIALVKGGLQIGDCKLQNAN